MGIRRLSVLGACLTLLAVTGCASGNRRVRQVPEPAVPVAREEPKTTGVVHTVSAGQTLTAIARAYGVTVSELAAANGLGDPDRLSIGQRLAVPGARRALPVEATVPAAGAARDDLLWPVPGGSILSGFGAPRGRHRHQGLDIRGRYGQPVVAVASGRVDYSGAGMRGYGKTLVIDHGQGLQSLYAHNSKLLVREGERVERGQVIARIGRTGNASTEHCHLEIRQNDVPRDPLLFVASRAGGRR